MWSIEMGKHVQAKERMRGQANDWLRRGVGIVSSHSTNSQQQWRQGTDSEDSAGCTKAPYKLGRCSQARPFQQSSVITLC